MSGKPIVDFVAGSEDFSDHGDWENARVYAINHPRLDTGTVYTSKIVKRLDDGGFETVNTIYRPKQVNWSEASHALCGISPVGVDE